MNLNNTYTYNKMECPICFEVLNSNIHTTSCNHHFHKNCIKNIEICPICRRDIQTNHCITIYQRKINPNTGQMWTIGMDINGNIKCSFPLWLS